MQTYGDNHSGCKSFYLVVDDEAGRIKSASYEMESDSRPAASAVKMIMKLLIEITVTLSMW